MKLHVELNDNGMLDDAYGKYASAADSVGRLSRRSFPFEVTEIPKAARALAIVFFDWDSVPVCGFPWIHWCALIELDEDASTFVMPDDASRTGLACMMQGFNSAAKSEPQVGEGYVGPCPPNADHIYSLRVYALDEVPSLRAPFWVNEMIAAARQHTLAQSEIELPSRA